MARLGEWGSPEREWTQSAQFGPPCVPTDCDPRTGLPRDPLTGQPAGLAGDPGFGALLQLAGRVAQGISTIASPSGGAQTFQPPPHIAPPFRARPLTSVVRAVMSPSVAAPGSFGADAAAALAVASGLPGAALSLLPATSGIGGQQLLLNFTTPQGYRTVVSGVGVEVSDAVKNSVLFTVVIGAPPTQAGTTMKGGTPLFDPTPLAVISTLENPTEIPANVPENVTIQIWARNLDPNFGALVEAGLFGWTYPALQQADSLSSSLSQTQCALDGMERVDCPPCGPGGGS